MVWICGAAARPMRANSCVHACMHACHNACGNNPDLPTKRPHGIHLHAASSMVYDAWQGIATHTLLTHACLLLQACTAPMCTASIIPTFTEPPPYQPSNSLHHTNTHTASITPTSKQLCTHQHSNSCAHTKTQTAVHTPTWTQCLGTRISFTTAYTRGRGAHLNGLLSPCCHTRKGSCKCH